MSSDWPYVRLGDIAETRKAASSTGEEEDYVGLENLEPGNPRIQGTVEAAGMGSATPFKPGDVLFGKLRPYLKKVAVADFVGCCSNEILVWKPRDDKVVSPGYLALVLQSGIALSHAVATSAGSRMPRTSQKAMSELKLVLPPIHEQVRISDLIAAVDTATEAALDAAASSRVALQRLQMSSPAGEKRTVGDVLAEIHTGVTTTSTEQAAGKLGQRLVKASAVLPAEFVPNESKPVGDLTLPEAARVRHGDLLMTRINTPERVGHICIADDVPDNLFRPDLIWRLIVDETVARTEFLEHLLSSPRYRKIIASAASGTSRSMQQISKARFSKIELEIPTFAEQDEYVGRCSAARDANRALSRVVQTLRDLRRELVSVLLPGTHRIPELYDELMGA